MYKAVIEQRQTSYKAAPMVKDKQQRVEHQITHNWYLRYEGGFMTTQLFEVFQKPSFEVRFKIRVKDGLWELYDKQGKRVMHAFQLINILTYVRNHLVK